MQGLDLLGVLTTGNRIDEPGILIRFVDNCKVLTLDREPLQLASSIQFTAAF